MSGTNCIQGMRLSAYLDGELSGNDLKEIGEHLANCQDCRDAHGSMKAGLNALRECMPEAVPPEYVKQQLFRKIRAISENRRHAGIRAWIGIGSISPWRSKAWVAACVPIVFFTIALSIFQYHRRLEDHKILAEIGRSRAARVAQSLSMNPFDFEAREGKLRASRENPFESFLNER